jgi:tetratricopeptide (TPR) repeat protein
MALRFLTMFFATATLFATGCGSSQVAESKVATSEQSVTDSITAFSAGDFAKAEQAASQAIDGGGLPVDLFVKALMVRAASRGIAGQFDTALADLDQAAQGAGEMDQVHGLRSLILSAKGEAKTAAEELAKAKQFNKTLKLPTDLKKWEFGK